MVGVDRHRRVARQSGVGAGLVDNHADGRSCGLAEDAMRQSCAAFIRQPPIGHVNVAQARVIGDQCACDRTRPSEKPQMLQQTCLSGSGMRRRGEDHPRHAIKQISRLRPSRSLLLKVEQDLLYDQTAEAMADESDRLFLKVGFAKQPTSADGAPL